MPARAVRFNLAFFKTTFSVPNSGVYSSGQTIDGPPSSKQATRLNRVSEDARPMDEEAIEPRALNRSSRKQL
ncbi:hypothetical protein EDC60_0978 [Diaphorobacter nitroreducens]|uniref:Uncharacterized protein n=1 Tax=Diaphorobacter nitroreducens TaxID=164759 RepID=A0AAX1WWM9_9BURK|nr:hypothetical protein EDC60_0978 [Diaphorobacter nitroreducens]